MPRSSTLGGGSSAPTPRSSPAAGGELEGARILRELITHQQRPAFADWADAVGEEWQRGTFGVLDARDNSTDDRQIWLRRLPNLHLELVAEPAWTENRQLVEQVLQLNDDLIGAQRHLSRRQRQLEQAQNETARSELRVRQLERILLAGLTPRNFDDALHRLLVAAQEVLPGDRIDILLHDEALDRSSSAPARGRGRHLTTVTRGASAKASSAASRPGPAASSSRISR